MRRADICLLPEPFRALTLAVSFAIFLMLPAQAQDTDTCNAVLSGALLTKRLMSNTAETSESERYWACSASSSDIRRYLRSGSRGGKERDGSVKYGDFSIKGKSYDLSEQNSSDDQIDTWKKESCTKSDRSANLSAAGFLAEQFVEPAAVDAWLKCMLNLQGLQCVARKQGASQINLIISYRTDDGILPKLGDQDFFVQRGNSSTREYIKHSGQLYIGRRSYVIDRSSDTDTSITLNAVKGLAAVDCNVFVPKDEPKPAAAVPPEKPKVDALASVVDQDWCHPDVLKEGGSILRFQKENDRIIMSRHAYLVPASGVGKRDSKPFDKELYDVTFFPEGFVGLVHEVKGTSQIYGHHP